MIPKGSHVIAELWADESVGTGGYCGLVYIPAIVDPLLVARKSVIANLNEMFHTPSQINDIINTWTAYYDVVQDVFRLPLNHKYEYISSMLNTKGWPVVRYGYNLDESGARGLEDFVGHD